MHLLVKIKYLYQDARCNDKDLEEVISECDCYIPENATKRDCLNSSLDADTDFDSETT